MLKHNVNFFIRSAKYDIPHSDEKLFHSKYISLSYNTINIDAIIIIIMVIFMCNFTIDQIAVS